MIGPRATYRVQLQPDFDLAAAAALVEHLDRLGISHLYLSPITQAVPGSTHGYDVVDPGIVSGELGGTPALLELVETLRAHAMGLLVDIVPNHVAAHEYDTRWWSLLGEGRGGPDARVFDVEWDAPGADGRVVLPMLGEPVADAIAAGRLRVEARADGLVVDAGGLVLPVAGPTVTGDDVETVLAAQHYRLEFWRTGEQHVNYRRFFDIATLPAVRVEERDVFDTQHALVASLLDAGVVDGVRVDHVDGLRIPGRYLAWLRDLGARWIVVEKILARDETLPASWAADGTTGYEFAERAGGALVDGSHETEFTRWWEEIAADTSEFDEIARDGRSFVVERLFRADLARITRAFARAVGRRPELEHAIAAMLSGFDVYRTYVEPGGRAGPVDDSRLGAAASSAIRAGAHRETVEVVCSVLRGDVEGTDADDARLRFQQLCAAVTAKGVEDTAAYRYFRFAARNEVGGDPARFAWTIGALHDANARALRYPTSLLALSTHDTKRSADVRARLAVLSEVPDQWHAFVTNQHARLAEAWAPVEPDPAIEYLLLQSVVGAWPISRERLARYAVKAAREAKVRTSWRDPEPGYEAALERVVASLTGARASARVEQLVDRVLVPGRVNSLAQVVLQCTTPGVPDTYWGDELWNLTLVDPDNRDIPSPAARRLLIELGRVARCPDRAVLADAGDPGRPKLWTLSRCLDLRRRRPEWFGPDATYRAIPTRGDAREHVIAWSRAEHVVAVVPRLSGSRTGGWADTTLELPPGRWVDVFTGVHGDGGQRDVAELLRTFPVGVLERLGHGDQPASTRSERGASGARTVGTDTGPA